MSRKGFNSYSFIPPYVPLTDENRFMDTAAWWIPVAKNLERHGIPPCPRVPVYLCSSSPEEQFPMIVLPAAVAHKLRVPCMVRIPRSRLRPVYSYTLWSMAMHRVCKVTEYGTTHFDSTQGD